MQTITEPSAASANGYWDESLPDGNARFRARIGGLHCSLCTGTIERALGRRVGVAQVSVSLTHEQALVDYDPDRISPDDLVETLSAIGYRLYDPRRLRAYEDEEAELVREGRRLMVAIGASLAAIGLIVSRGDPATYAIPVVVGAFLLSAVWLVLSGQGRLRARGGTVAVAGIGAAAVAWNATGVAAGAIPWVVAALAAGVTFVLASHILDMAWQSLRRGILNQHVMLEAGAFAGLAGGALGLAGGIRNYPTAAFFAVSVLVVNYHIFSEWLSLLVKTRSSQAVKRLLDLQPDTATVVKDGVERTVAVSDIGVGETVRVRPGERVPVDGKILEGSTAVDQSLVTGEAVPVEVGPGSAVIGGSVNTNGSVLVTVTATGEGSFLSQVVRSVEDARALKPGILHLVDRILRVYTPTVLSLSVLSFLGWAVGSWAVSGSVDTERAVFAALSVLVMGYPCAVGIAAPLSLVRGAGEAAEVGILMRTGEAFQALRQVSTVVFDKTGTLTEGRPALRSVAAAPGFGEEEVLAIAAAVESPSEHPLGRAIVTTALERDVAFSAPSGFSSITGLGVRAVVDGAAVVAGRPAFLAAEGIDVSGLADHVEAEEAAGRTVVLVAHAGRLAGAVALGDQIRPDAAAAVSALRSAGIRTVLLSGDNEKTAAIVGSQAGVDEVMAGVLPGGKAETVRLLQEHGRVAMVGDGINDAPALMQADVGVAMGGGTDIAMESADVIILNSALMSVVAAKEISRRSYRKTRQNVALAFAFNGIGIPLAATGLLYPVWAMAAMALSVSAIFANSLWGRPQLLVQALASVGRD